MIVITKLLKKINNMIQVIEENPELFHDGIDEEIVDLLKEIRENI